MSSSMRKRGKEIYNEFGDIKAPTVEEGRAIRRWASQFAHFHASGIPSWLDQIAPELPAVERKRITKNTNASLWRGRHDAMRFAKHSGRMEGISHNPEEGLCSAIDRKSKGVFESYGTNQDVAPGNKVVIAIDRHVFQGFVGTVKETRPDGKYLVVLNTELQQVAGYFSKDELISLRSYVRSRHEKIPNSYSVGPRSSRNAALLAT